jgi:hypothetical protein
LLLDKEKAYDRVNLNYLKAVLLRFGFAVITVDCINNLMANNTIEVNVNGFITKEVHKLRGLRQGDLLSPILYNLAFEPFLRSILNDEHFGGYSMRADSGVADGDNTVEESITTKILCYTNDALVLVHDVDELYRLKSHMGLFCNASNATFNYNKVDTFSLSGLNTWEYWHRPLSSMNIDRLTSEDDPTPIIYLGFR